MPVRANAMVEASTGTTITIHFHFVSEGGPAREQLREVRLFDRFNRRIEIRQPGACVYFFDVITPPIPRDSLPLFVEATECDGVLSPREVNGPIFMEFMTIPGPGIPMPCVATMCDSNTACNDAVAAAMEFHNNLSTTCEECGRLRDRADEREREGAVMLAAAFVLFLLGLALLAMSFWVNALIGVIFIGLSIWLGNEASRAFAEAHAIRARQRECEERADRHRAQFRAAMVNVNGNCCPSCITVPLFEPC